MVQFEINYFINLNFINNNVPYDLMQYILNFYYLKVNEYKDFIIDYYIMKFNYFLNTFT